MGNLYVWLADLTVLIASSQSTTSVHAGSLPVCPATPFNPYARSLSIIFLLNLCYK